MCRSQETGGKEQGGADCPCGEEWALIPMEVVNSACESIARRVEEVRHAGGYATGH